MADPDEALTGREASAASAVASPALIEAIAQAIVATDPDNIEPGRPEAWMNEARAAHAAMVEHLGLVEETRTTYAIVQRRLVSRWVEVDHGSE